MNAGESALFHVGHELAYGKEGSFSFPNVPPMADVIYEVELVGFEQAREVSLSVQKSFKALGYSEILSSSFLVLLIAIIHCGGGDDACKLCL